MNPEVLDCDYYRFKELDAGAVNAFQNEYEPKYRAGRVLQAEGPARFDQFILNSIKMFKNNLMEFNARVSTKEQNLDRQIAAFVAMGAEEREIITDKESGKSLDRPGYQALKNVILRKGDTLVVKSLDRLSRSKTDIRNELQFFKDQGIRLKVIDLPTTMMDLPEGQSWVFEMVNNILIEVMGTIAEQERLTIKQRQAEGIAAAKAKGKRLGKPPMKKPENWEQVYPEVIYKTERIAKRMEEIQVEMERLRQEAEERVVQMRQEVAENLEPT